MGVSIKFTPFFMKKFIALDVNDYKLGKGVTPVNLVWKGNTIKDWCNEIKFSRRDVVVGHSLGAAIALIAAERTPPKELHLYSPSPIFMETIKLLDKKNLDHFGKRRQKEVRAIPNVSCSVSLYYGTEELPVMKRTALKIASKLSNCKLIALHGRNHQTVINQAGIKYQMQ